MSHLETTGYLLKYLKPPNTVPFGGSKMTLGVLHGGGGTAFGGRYWVFYDIWIKTGERMHGGSVFDESVFGSVSLYVYCIHYKSVCIHYKSVCIHYTSVCIHYTPVCIHYTSVCIHYKSVCIHYTPVCIHYTPVCIHYTPVCIHYTSVCIHYKSVCIHYKSVCIHYTPVYIHYTSVCIHYTPVCIHYTSVCIHYTSVCIHYTPVCIHYTPVCIHYIHSGNNFTDAFNSSQIFWLGTQMCFKSTSLTSFHRIITGWLKGNYIMFNYHCIMQTPG